MGVLDQYDINSGGGFIDQQNAALGPATSYAKGAMDREAIKLARANAIIKTKEAANYEANFDLEKRKVDILQQHEQNTEQQLKNEWANIQSEIASRNDENQTRELARFTTNVKQAHEIAQSVLDAGGSIDAANKAGQNAYDKSASTLDKGHQDFKYDHRVAGAIADASDPEKDIGVREYVDPETGDTTTGQITMKGDKAFVIKADGSRKQVPTAGMNMPVQRTKDMGNQEEDQVRTSTAGVLNILDATKQTIGMLKDSPDVNTWVAKSASFVNDLHANVQALGRQTGITLDGGLAKLTDPKTYSATFEKLGIDNDRLQSLVTDLAFQTITAEQGRQRVSDRDMKLAMEIIGKEAQNPATFAQVLKDSAERQVQYNRNMRAVRGNRVNVGDADAQMDSKLNDINSLFDQQNGNSTADHEVISQGTLDNGIKMTVKKKKK